MLYHLHHFVSTFLAKEASCQNIYCITPNGFQSYLMCYGMMLHLLICINVYIYTYIILYNFIMSIQKETLKLKLNFHIKNIINHGHL